MKNLRNDPAQENQLPEALNLIPPAPPRDPQRAAAARTRFMAEARQFKRAALTAQPASPKLLPQLDQWVMSLKIFLTQKERKPMFATIVSIIVSLALLAGGGAATVYAAQDSLPNDFLYPVKTWQEDYRLDKINDAQAQVDRLLDYSNVRLQEMLGLAAIGEPIPSIVAERMNLLNERAILLAAEMESEGVITKIHRHLRDQDQVMAMTRSNAPDFTDPVLHQAQEQVAAQLRLLEPALGDPVMLKNALQERMNAPEDAAFGPADGVTPGDGQGTGPGPLGTQAGAGEPQGPVGPLGTQTDGYGPGPQAGPEEPPAGPEYGPGSNYGPGNENGSYYAPKPTPKQYYYKTPSPSSGSGTQTQSGGGGK